MTDSNVQTSRISIVRVFLGCIIAVLVTTLLSSMLSTWFNLQEIVKLGAEISFTNYLETMTKDFGSFAPTFFVVTAVGFLIAFLVAGLLRRYIPLPRWLSFGLAGAASMAVMLFLIKKYAMGMQPIGAAKVTSGYILLLVSGALGGIVFSQITRRFTAA